jgi:dTMP kinase
MGLLVTFEGPDGSGKSTQARMLAASLRAWGHDVVETREPGGTPLGEAVRHILLDADGLHMSALTMTLLLSASRSQLVEDVIKPALSEGSIVVVDRYTDSTIAYQSFGQGLDENTVRELSRIATQGVRPRITVFVDIPVEIGLERVARRVDRNRLDALDVAFHTRVREGYLATIEADPGRWLVVDGRGSPDEVHSDIWTRLSPVLEEVAHPT